MKREIIARVHILNDLIAEKETALARLKCSACDPAAAAMDRIGGKRCGNLREDHLISYIDNAAELQKSIDRLRSERAPLCEDIQTQLDNDYQQKRFDYWTTRIVKYRLIWACSWYECADLSGFCMRTCEKKYDNWIASCI